MGNGQSLKRYQLSLHFCLIELQHLKKKGDKILMWKNVWDYKSKKKKH